MTFKIPNSAAMYLEDVYNILLHLFYRVETRKYVNYSKNIIILYLKKIQIYEYKITIHVLYVCFKSGTEEK